jgi:exodeoxyribonuclease VII large subunit
VVATLTGVTLRLFDQPAGGPPRQITLVRLSGEIARSLGSVGRVAVQGEVYRPTTSRGGWVFFTLRDRAAQIDVKVPASHARRSRVVQGERVSVVGGLQWANDRGQVHLVAEEVSPVGAGAIAALIADTRRQLAAEGLLERPRRRLPRLPAAIGVVCGADAAVRKDIESVAAARFPGYPLHFQETTVSGPGASLAIVEALAALVQRPGVEVVIVARGGGDGPSLLPWSTEEVCRAVAACPVPVVSAIGHESDRPLCDEVADLRCGTPSLAATAIIPDREAVRAALDGCLMRSAAALGAGLEGCRRRLDVVDPRLALDRGIDGAAVRLEWSAVRLRSRHPAARIEAGRTRLAAADWRRPAWETLARAEGRLGADLRHLRALSPARTLDRGYAVVTGPDGAVVRRAGDLAPGEVVSVRVAAGSFEASVTDVQDAGSAGGG